LLVKSPKEEEENIERLIDAMPDFLKDQQQTPLVLVRVECDKSVDLEPQIASGP
jgi:hypothetical protein